MHKIIIFIVCCAITSLFSMQNESIETKPASSISGNVAPQRTQVAEYKTEIFKAIECKLFSEFFSLTSALTAEEWKILNGHEHYEKQLIHWAAYHGNVQALEMLIGHGALVEARTKEGATPLYFAAQNGHDTIIKILTQLGARVHVKTNNDETPLHWAAERGQCHTIKLLKNLGAQLDAQEKYGATPLHWAAIRGSYDAIKTLIELGSQVNAKAKDGATPLRYAVDNDDYEAIKILIELGADVFLPDQEEESPFDVAIPKVKKFMLQVLRLEDMKGPNTKRQNGQTLLIESAMDGNTTIVQDLLHRKDIDVNAVDNDGNSALHVAALEGHAYIVELLLRDNRVNKMLVNNQGNTAFHLAIQKYKTEVIAHFLVLKVPANNPNREGHTEEILARRNPPMARLLTILDKINAGFQEVEKKKPLDPSFRENLKRFIFMALKNAQQTQTLN